jgi:hypothetical protein
VLTITETGALTNMVVVARSDIKYFLTKEMKTKREEKKKTCLLLHIPRRRRALTAVANCPSTKTLKSRLKI